jgi:hypothetical protein
METATDTTRAVVPGRQQFHPGHPKFWALIDFPAGVATLTSSYNVTSISDDGTGLVTLTIATDFSSANWCCLATAKSAATTRIVYVTAMAAGTVSLRIDGLAGTAVDPEAIYVAGFGDQ